MKTIHIILLCLLASGIQAQSKISFTPVEHASFVIQAPGLVIYIDPVGNTEDYSSFPAPDIILITHTHGDHFNPQLKKPLKPKKQKLWPTTKLWKSLEKAMR